MKYILTIKKLGDLFPKAEQKKEENKPEAVLKQLAICYRDANKKTRKNSVIIKAESWQAMDGNGDEIQRFRFLVRYDADNVYLYIYSFEGCGL